MEFLFLTFLAKPLWLWLLFLTIVITLMVFDLGVLHKDDHELGVAESLKLSAFYIAIAIAFGGYIWWAWSNGTLVTSDGTNPVAAYFQGYIIEKVLSIDNVFVISLIFGYFAIPRKYQYRALVWGIIGVIILRGLMIAVGAELIAAYDWVTLVFAAFLAFTGLVISLWPYLIWPSITLWDAAAHPISQAFLLVGTMFLLPIILLYVIWSYWVFRGKVRAGHGYH